MNVTYPKKAEKLSNFGKIVQIMLSMWKYGNHNKCVCIGIEIIRHLIDYSLTSWYGITFYISQMDPICSDILNQTHPKLVIDMVLLSISLMTTSMLQSRWSLYKSWQPYTQQQAQFLFSLNDKTNPSVRTNVVYSSLNI